MEFDETFWTAVSAVAAVVAAALAWWSTRKAASAAADAAETARELAAIERDRWHRELAPDLRFTLDSPNSSPAVLSVALAGPVGLDRLDSIVVTVRDEAGIDHEANALDLDPHELATMIWGPFRFRPHVNGASQTGRQIVLTNLERGEVARRAMEYTRAPSWFDGHELGWRARTAQQPIRLRAECHRDGYRPWIVVAELPSAASGGQATSP